MSKYSQAADEFEDARDKCQGAAKSYGRAADQIRATFDSDDLPSTVYDNIAKGDKRLSQAENYSLSGKDILQAGTIPPVVEPPIPGPNDPILLLDEQTEWICSPNKLLRKLNAFPSPGTYVGFIYEFDITPGEWRFPENNKANHNLFWGTINEKNKDMAGYVNLRQSKWHTKYGLNMPQEDHGKHSGPNPGTAFEPGQRIIVTYELNMSDGLVHLSPGDGQAYARQYDASPNGVTEWTFVLGDTLTCWTGSEADSPTEPAPYGLIVHRTRVYGILKA